MTDYFWLIAAVLVLLALAFVVYPLFSHRSGKRAEINLRNQNLLAYRSRMAELDGEYEAGILDEENYRQLREELAGSMLDDVPDADKGILSTSARGKGGRSPYIVALLSLVIIPAATILLYQKWGAMDQVEQFMAMEELAGEGEGARLAQMNSLAGQLRERLEAKPDNPEGWAMLGRTYMRLEQYPEAAWAFERLAENVGEDDRARATAWGLAAQAWFFENQGEMTSEVEQAIDKAQSLHADEVNSLGLLGIYAFGQENYEEAIRHWERIAEVEPDHPQLSSIRQGIEEAYARLGREAPPQPDQPAAEGAGVTVRIEISDAFSGQVPDDTTVFLFAREAGSQGAPLAVARLTAADLPTEIRLDDRFAMSPAAKLSDAEEVQLVARLSRSGTATAQAGDWEGRLDNPVAVSHDHDVAATLVIDKQLRN